MTIVQDIDARARASQRHILVLSAHQSLASALTAIDAANPEWVVIVRETDKPVRTYLYAFRPEEIRRVRIDAVADVEKALQLHEGRVSGVQTYAGEGITQPGGDEFPSIWRTIIVDDDGTPAGVVVHGRDPTRGIGDVRGTEPVSARSSSETIDVRLATRVPVTMLAGEDDVLDVLIAAAADALDLPGAGVARSSMTEPISVVLSLVGDAVSVTGPRVLKMVPPQAGSPSQSAFELHADREGSVHAAVMFRQGGSELGSVRHQIRVVTRLGDRDRAGGNLIAAPRVPGDEGVLLLQVEPLIHGGEIRYRYRVQCPRLDLDFMTFESPPLLAVDGSAADSEIAFVHRIYANMTNSMLRTRDQVIRFSLEVEAFAEDLCRQLFPLELIRLLWDARGKFDAVRVMSWEPYIPWELIKLAIPHEQKVDDCFFSQYGVVRWLAGRSAPRTLRLDNWSYYAATYPNNPADDVTKEVDYFTTRLPQHGIWPVQVPASYDGLVKALQNPDFDVLHVACHGDVKEDNIEKAELVITDELVNGRPNFVSISANVVAKIARFGTRRPLLFLNACEAGRMGKSLTAWGGWPSHLINAGAGAVVGTSWPVRDLASNMFATSFYDALLSGKSLSAAASDARKATAVSGDATWLSFKVFGDPHACRLL
jgi:hypothetical protein